MLPIILLAFLAIHCAQAQLENYKQSSGYVDVRKGAHLFYWLFYTTAPVQNYTERPLIIWLHGGPGTTSSGYGNFLNVGPLTASLEQRNESLVKNFNVMFLDNPVGTGFSYVDDPILFTKTNLEIANDFMVFIREFYHRNPEFEVVPLYLYGQAYGSKMSVDMAIKLNQAEKEGTIKSNLRGIIMENPWVSPLDHVYSMLPVLQSAALIEKDGYEKILTAVKETERLYNEGQYAESKIQRNKTSQAVTNATTAIDFNDFFNGALTTIPDTRNAYDNTTEVKTPPNNPPEDKLQLYMNSVVKKLLNIPEKLVWTLYTHGVFVTIDSDFMKPVVNGIENLLTETNLAVTVLNGNLDLICNTAGQVAWISKLKWPGEQEFRKTLRQPIWENDRLEGYYKKHGKFSFYEVNGAGHYVAQYNPDAVRFILRNLTTFG